MPLYNYIERSQYYACMVGHCDPFVSQMPENPTLKPRYLPAPEKLSEKPKNISSGYCFSRRSATFLRPACFFSELNQLTHKSGVLFKRDQRNGCENVLTVGVSPKTHPERHVFPRVFSHYWGFYLKF